MAELSLKERLQPSLLDRLTDDEPEVKQEPATKRVLSLQRLRESVLRDLGWLFNATNMRVKGEFEDCPLVEHSVLNYGLPDLAGVAVSNINAPNIERQMRQAIWDFEPRILPSSLRVRIVKDTEAMEHNALVFEIEGDLWAQPVPLQILLKTELDLESGAATVAESSGSES